MRIYVMGNKGMEMTTPIWFDRWVKAANRRNERQRQIALVLDTLATIFVAVGIIMVLVGASWIDSMDVCKGNVLLCFFGVALTAAGSRIKWLIGGTA